MIMVCPTGIGSYDCGLPLRMPGRSPRGNVRVPTIDKCLVSEVKQLWAAGVRTTGCCCGHGVATPYIGVIEAHISAMKRLGYEATPNNCRPDAKDSFYPKTKMPAEHWL
jgi:hypothetical protein